MKTLFNFAIALSMAFIGVITISAQDERNNVEVFAGYSYHLTDTGLNDDFDEDFDFDFDDKLGSHGFNGSVTGNFHRYAGVKGDFSYHTKTDDFDVAPDSFRLKYSTTQFLGGVQFKDNAVDSGRVKPFAHILAGIAHQRINASGSFTDTGGGGDGGGGEIIVFDESVSANNFAMAFGAGVDVRVNRNIDIRLFQVDYNPVFFRDRDVTTEISIPGSTQNNFRFSVGVVFH